MEVRPKDLGGSHADQIFVFSGSPECFAVRLSKEIASAPPHPVNCNSILLEELWDADKILAIQTAICYLIEKGKP